MIYLKSDNTDINLVILAASQVFRKWGLDMTIRNYGPNFVDLNCPSMADQILDDLNKVLDNKFDIEVSSYPTALLSIKKKEI